MPEDAATIRGFIRAELPDDEDVKWIRLEVEIVKPGKEAVVYGALEMIKRHKVIGVVVLVQGDEKETRHKEMEESMGPFYWGASRYLLSLLTQTDNMNSLEWRAKCMRNS
jgi:hypothetical protein